LSDPKPNLDVRPYAVVDALSPDLPRVVVQTSPAAAVSHVVGARFSATALNAMEVLALTARGVQVEDPRGVLPVVPQQAEPEQHLLPIRDPLDSGFVEGDL
jgi:hypothetical protein